MIYKELNVVTKDGYRIETWFYPAQPVPEQRAAQAEMLPYKTLGKYKGKAIGELETADYQLTLLYGYSLEEQADAILEIIDKGNSRELLVELTEVYKSQDLDRLWELFKESMTSYEYDAVIKVRNLNWEKQMKELLPKQTTIFVVGAGHLPGEYGMINLLREAGYKVTPVKK